MTAGGWRLSGNSVHAWGQGLTDGVQVTPINFQLRVFLLLPSHPSLPKVDRRRPPVLTCSSQAIHLGIHHPLAARVRGMRMRRRNRRERGG